MDRHCSTYLGLNGQQGVGVEWCMIGWEWWVTGMALLEQKRVSDAVHRANNGHVQRGVLCTEFCQAPMIGN